MYNEWIYKNNNLIYFQLVFVSTFLIVLYALSFEGSQIDNFTSYTFASSSLSKFDVADNKEHEVSSNQSDITLEFNASDIQRIAFDKLSEEDKPLLCGDNTVQSSFYVKEYLTPILCSQPVGISVDKDNNIWIASGKSGTLMQFNPSMEKFVKIIKIPNWPEQNRNIGSMIWDMKFDKDGNLWFTDEITNSIWKYFTNEARFENYRLLGENGYPLSLAFDSDDNVWYTQVFGKRLGFLEPDKVITNTTEGISELDISRQINFQTMGPISNGLGVNDSFINNNDSNVNQSLWFSTAVFPVGGQIIKYDINSHSLTIHDINHTQSVPFSISEDEEGLLWANSHIANLFLSLNPLNGEIKQYATSNPSASGNLTTLPYYNIFREGKIWFNEHYGNAIASFDPKDNTLVEYYIPTHNPLWANSSNPLRFVFDNNGSIWFTEWTQNKLGVLSSVKLNQLPITLELSKNNVTLDSTNLEGDAVDIYIYGNPLSSNKLANFTSYEAGLNTTVAVSMDLTSSISKDGKLDNLTGSFSDPSLLVQRQINSSTSEELMTPSTTSLKIDPLEGVIPGNYTLTISAKLGTDLTISKIIDLIIN